MYWKCRKPASNATSIVNRNFYILPRSIAGEKPYVWWNGVQIIIVSKRYIAITLRALLFFRFSMFPPEINRSRDRNAIRNIWCTALDYPAAREGEKWRSPDVSRTATANCRRRTIKITCLQLDVNPKFLQTTWPYGAIQPHSRVILYTRVNSIENLNLFSSECGMVGLTRKSLAQKCRKVYSLKENCVK